MTNILSGIFNTYSPDPLKEFNMYALAKVYFGAPQNLSNPVGEPLMLDDIVKDFKAADLEYTKPLRDKLAMLSLGLGLLTIGLGTLANLHHDLALGGGAALSGLATIVSVFKTIDMGINPPLSARQLRKSINSEIPGGRMEMNPDAEGCEEVFRIAEDILVATRGVVRQQYMLPKAPMG